MYTQRRINYNGNVPSSLYLYIYYYFYILQTAARRRQIRISRIAKVFPKTTHSCILFFMRICVCAILDIGYRKAPCIPRINTNDNKMYAKQKIKKPKRTIKFSLYHYYRVLFIIILAVHPEFSREKRRTNTKIEPFFRVWNCVLHIFIIFHLA